MLAAIQPLHSEERSETERHEEQRDMGDLVSNYQDEVRHFSSGTLNHPPREAKTGALLISRAHSHLFLQNPKPQKSKRQDSNRNQNNPRKK
jgi:hypothetical protein